MARHYQKLTWPIVHAMRAADDQYDGPKVEILERFAREYGVSRKSIRAALSRQSWRVSVPPVVPSPHNNTEHRIKRDQQLQMWNDYKATLTPRRETGR